MNYNIKPREISAALDSLGDALAQVGAASGPQACERRSLTTACGIALRPPTNPRPPVPSGLIASPPLPQPQVFESGPPCARGLALLALSASGRGGEGDAGQRIRDEILAVQQRSGVKVRLFYPGVGGGWQARQISPPSWARPAVGWRRVVRFRPPLTRAFPAMSSERLLQCKPAKLVPTHLKAV